MDIQGCMALESGETYGGLKYIKTKTKNEKPKNKKHIGNFGTWRARASVLPVSTATTKSATHNQKERKIEKSIQKQKYSIQKSNHRMFGVLTDGIVKALGYRLIL